MYFHLGNNFKTELVHLATECLMLTFSIFVEGITKCFFLTLSENKIVGKHLPHFIDKSGNLQLQMVERCGLRELCHQLDFKIALESLLESGMETT